MLVLLDRIKELTKSFKNTGMIKRIPSFIVMFVMILAFMCGNAGELHTSGAALSKAEPAADQDVFMAKSGAKKDQATSEGEASDEQNSDFAELIKAAKLSTMDEKAKARLASEDEDQDLEDSKKKKSSEKEGDSDGFVYSQHIPLSYQLQEYLFEKCAERDLEYELVLAIIWRESRFEINAVNINTNGTRDNGLMQINDVNRKWLKNKYGVNDLMDPYQNIDAGTAMLGELTQKYGLHNAMMAYQYGEGGMGRKLRQGVTTSHAIETAYSQRDYYRQII